MYSLKKVIEVRGDKNTYYSFIANKGIYLIECWGARGGNSGGCGGYSSGYIKFNTDISLYLYPGAIGSVPQKEYSFNGGGTGQEGGGGASDVRLIEGEWYQFESLKSRIIVAGGGGGKDGSSDFGGAGGGIEGLSSSLEYGKGGTQTSGGDSNATFGKGGGNDRFGKTVNIDGCGAGGGGYFGGGKSSVDWYYSGGGGSSFISGHDGCRAVSPNSTAFESIEITNQSTHYSGHVFFSTNIINGNSQMPSPKGGFERGHCDYGVIKIYQVLPLTCQNHKTLYFHLIQLISILLLK